MLTGLVKNQLRLFVIITALALSVLAVYYVRIPAMLGIGRYNVLVQLPNAGGLYPKANVTYRGYEVGQVRSVDLRPGGKVVAHLEIDNSAKIPVDAIAQVHSASVIGEQYIDFVPPTTVTSNRMLADGNVVPASRTTLPTKTDSLITSVDDFLKSIPNNDLNTTVNELGAAFDGSGEDLGNIIDSGSKLSQAATDNLTQTKQLIDSLHPVLTTQENLDQQIRSYARSLDTLTNGVAKANDDLNAVIQTGAPLVQSVSSFTSSLGPQLAGLLNDLDQTGTVLNAYRPGIEHALIVLPAAVQMSGAGIPPEHLLDEYTTSNVYFKMSSPTPCTQGFPYKDKMRSPYDLSLAPLPQDSYCKVAPDSQLVARGVRNHPCPNDSSRRSATAAGCGLVFDKTAVQRAAVVQDGNINAMVSPQMAKLLAPNGWFYLVDPGASAGASTLSALMKEMVDR
ncbi:MAG: MCE family protein [Actinomycetes bacterium]